MKKILSTILALAACTTLTAQDFKITHGPWLCDLTSDGVTVVWATSKPALSWVEVAEDDGRSFYAAEHERRYETVAGRKQARKTLHSIRLKGLRPDTKYRYRIFSQEVREWKYNDKVYYGDIAASNVYSRQPFAFSTLPTSGCDLSFVVLNDIHGRADYMAGLCRPIDFAQIDFVAFNGDMSNSTESPEQLYRDFIDASVGAFASETPILYNRGNHETRGIYADHLPEYFPKVGGNYYKLYMAGSVAVLLLDCGEGTQAAARRAGVNLMKLDAICLTHYHGDHIFGLPGLLQTLGCQGRERPLTLYGPEGLGEVWPALRTLTGPLPYPVRAVQLDTDPIDLTTLSSGWPAGAQLTPFRTRHRVPSRGYRLDLPRAGRFDPAKARALNVPVPAWKLLQRGQSIPLENGAVVAPADVLGPARRGLRFVFSGDTAPCPALEQAAQNADLFLCDATYPDNEQEAQAKQWGHSTFAQGAAIAKKAGVRRFWLMHYSPMILEPEAALPNAQAVFPAAECGFDGKQIILQYDEEAT